MKHLVLAVGITLFACINAFALTPETAVGTKIDPQYLSYQEAVQFALRDNVDLLAIRDQESAQKLRAKQALSPNNPVFSFTKTDVPGFSFSQQAAEDIYAVNFTLGFPGKSWSQAASLRHQAESTGQQAIAKEVDIMTAISNNYIAFATNQSLYLFLLDEQKRNVELTKLLEKKFAASQAAKVDLLNADVTTRNIEQAILENRNDYEVLVTQFRQLIRRPEDRWLFPQIPNQIVIPSVKQGLEDLTFLMLKNRHPLLSASKQVESSESALTGAYLSPFPDFQLTFAVNNWHEPTAAPNPGLTRDYTLGIGVSVPIFLPLNEAQGIRAAQHDLSAAERQLESQKIQAIADLQTIYTSLSAANKALDSMSKFVVPAAKASYDLTLLTYSLGKADYFRLNDSRKSWHDAERDLLAKRQSAAQLYNQLIAQVGCDIGKAEGPHACQ
jgi:outer membrane protein TolC